MRLFAESFLSVLITEAYVFLVGSRLAGVVEQCGGSHAWVVDFSQRGVFE
jgi:hypothetical protein